MKDKVALITGGGSGLGREMAMRLAQAGARVALVDRDPAGLDTTLQLAPGSRAYACDVTDGAAIADVVARVERELGPVHRLAIAAGIMPAASVEQMPAETFARVMRVNYEGLVYTVKAALPAMKQRGAGEIILFGSLAGVVYSQNFAAYGASKAAVNAFGEVLAHELHGSGIQVLTVRPAAVATPLIRQATGEGGLAGLRKQVRSGRLSTAAQILDAMEAALRKRPRRYYLYPTAEARAGQWLRRFAPEFTWKLANRAHADD